MTKELLGIINNGGYRAFIVISLTPRLFERVDT